MPTVFHADDYGISLDQSKRILSCGVGQLGSLTSLSVLVNGSHLHECASLLRSECSVTFIGLHLNLVEGPCCSNPIDVPLLVDDEGIFKLSFARLLAMSLGPHRKDLREQIRLEVGCQLDRYLRLFPEKRDALRVDSHQHFHVIPLVMDALISEIETRGYGLEYIRIPFEPIAPYFTSLEAALAVPAINWVKHGLINFLWRLRKGKYRFLIDEGKTAVFCGINYSGVMYSDKLKSVILSFERYAKRRGMPLEVLFHPGGCKSSSELLNPSLDSFADFYLSESRDKEAEFLCRYCR